VGGDLGTTTIIRAPTRVPGSASFFRSLTVVNVLPSRAVEGLQGTRRTEGPADPPAASGGADPAASHSGPRRRPRAPRFGRWPGGAR